MMPLNNFPQFDSPNVFDTLRLTTDDSYKESNQQLNQNETDSHSPRSVNAKTKTKAPTTAILGDSI